MLPKKLNFMPQGEHSLFIDHIQTLRHSKMPIFSIFFVVRGYHVYKIWEAGTSNSHDLYAVKILWYLPQKKNENLFCTKNFYVYSTSC